jgi:uncharacterized protein
MSGLGSSQNEREVGKVVSVTTIAVKVELHSEERSPIRSYAGGLATIAQVGAYYLFPVGAGEYTVGVLTGAFEHEGYEPDAQGGMTLQLAKPRRTLSVNLLGTIDGKGHFLKGITVYPTLDTPAIIPDRSQLEAILTEISSIAGTKGEIVSIGFSPIYETTEIGLSIDDLFSRPLAIIGNTGSGKSWTVASLIQQTCEKLGVDKDSIAKFIILDTNGEYSKAFGAKESRREANTAYVDGVEFTLPLWLLELQEFVRYFGASAATQIPILERVITIIREDSFDQEQSQGTQPKNTKEARRTLRQVSHALEYVGKLRGCAQEVQGHHVGIKAKTAFENTVYVMKNWGTPLDTKYKDLNEGRRKKVKDLGEALKGSDLLRYVEQTPKNKELKDPYDALPESIRNQVDDFVDAIEPLLQELHSAISIEAGLPTITADTPICFDPQVLDRSEPFDLAISGMRGEDRIKEYIATLRLRIRRMLQDKRWKVFREDWEKEVTTVVRTLVGDGKIGKNVTIIDCSMLAYDVLPYFCGIVGRLLLEVRENADPDERIVQPWVIVLEEAHNYLRPRKEVDELGVALSREAYERIAKEGRKYGLSLLVASQRPSEVSDTVLSQCANFVVHRIQNPTDIDFFKKILPSGSREILDQVSILVPGEALLLGSASNVPCRVRVAIPHPEPRSKTSEPSKAWKAEAATFQTPKAIERWTKDVSAKVQPDSLRRDQEV